MSYSQGIYAYYTSLGRDGNLAEEIAQNAYYEYRQDGGKLSIDKWFSRIWENDPYNDIDHNYDADGFNQYGERAD